MKNWIFWAILLLPATATATPFTDARAAAGKGDYRAVITILSKAMTDHTLDASALAPALANRGVAYSLIGQYGKARRDLRHAIKLDPANNLARNQLGLIAERVDHNYKRAEKWYAGASAAGYAPAEANLARLYRYGLGVRTDDRHALLLYEQAVDQQYAPAYTPLGEMYFDGIGRSEYPRLAIVMFKQAAAAGDVAAHYYLGLAAQRGEGMSKDPEHAANQFREAAMAGYGPAQAALGDVYRLGKGAPQDLIEAAKWYRLAADQGVLSAADALARLLATCPTKQLCSGKAALALAHAVTRRRPTPQYMDTLAAAFARSGRFDLAVRTMDKVIAAIPARAPNREVYIDHRDRYRRDQALAH